MVALMENMLQGGLVAIATGPSTVLVCSLEPEHPHPSWAGPVHSCCDDSIVGNSVCGWWPVLASRPREGTLMGTRWRQPVQGTPRRISELNCLGLNSQIGLFGEACERSRAQNIVCKM